MYISTCYLFMRFFYQFLSANYPKVPVVSAIKKRICYCVKNFRAYRKWKEAQPAVVWAWPREKKSRNLHTYVSVVADISIQRYEHSNLG